MRPLDWEPAHPYARYGLAVALVQGKCLIDDEITDERCAELLAETLESELNRFRMRTADLPEIADKLRYDGVPVDELRSDRTLVQSSGLAQRGIYLFPSVVTTDGDAGSTFQSVDEILGALRKRSLASRWVLKRSFAPMTAKVNNGRPAPAEPKDTLFEAACMAICTLTERKPAAWVDKWNTVVIPDLPLEPLREFVAVFQEMITSKTGRELLSTRARAPKPASESPARKSARASTGGKGNAGTGPSYLRPRVHGGNYPFAPADPAAFGAAGVLAGIGRWSLEAGQAERGRKVLAAICPPEAPGRPLYVVSYDRVFQVQFNHHVVELAHAGKLSEILAALVRDTLLYSEADNPRPGGDSPARRLFHFAAGRFLQLFTPEAFRDFLAPRAEYSAAVNPLFEEYFMSSSPIPRDIVVSARVLGQHLNYTAYVVAENETEKEKADRHAVVRKAKAKILVEFESAVMSAKGPTDMMHRISTRAGRLLQNDLPEESGPFMDAANCGEIEFQDAQHLLIAYLRLRASGRKSERSPESDAQPAEDPLGMNFGTEAPTSQA